jgi:hypothetical protein
MPSRSLRKWQASGRKALDEFEAAHATAGRHGRRRHSAQQINQAYVLLLSAHFQSFCRNLHTECVEHLVSSLVQAPARMIVRRRFMDNRKLDAGNPNPGNIGSDFERFEITFWPAVRTYDRRADSRQRALMGMNQWRNAIAHQDFAKPGVGGRERLRIGEVRQWRSACEFLAVDFERVMYHYLRDTTGIAPW